MHRPLRLQPSLKTGETVSFVGTAFDPEGDSVEFTWNFGDGTSGSGASPTHTFTAAGTFVVIMTAIDQFGKAASTQLTIRVDPAPVPGRGPTARFTTSDVVGFVGLPLNFDASFSTDPDNAITDYIWSFGDGSPLGRGHTISRVYSAVGTYLVTLTVVDAEGASSTVSRQIVILGAEQAGLFNGFVRLKVKWDRSRGGVDTLSLDANMNVGDAQIGPGTSVAIEIVGKRFQAQLGNTLRSKAGGVTWQVVANTKRQAFGDALLKLRLKKADLGVAFNQAGIIAGGDSSELVTADVPVRIELGNRIIDVLVETDFKFSRDGKKASGEGEGPE